MSTTFKFTEATVRALKPPVGKDRAYHKDKVFPGLQVCVTSTGTRTYYFVKRIDGKPTRIKMGTTTELSVSQARKSAAKEAAKVADGKNPQAEKRHRREEPTLQNLYDHWMVYSKAHKKESSIAQDRCLWKNHLSIWASRRLSSITKADTQSLHAKIGTESGPYVANRTLAFLSAMMNKADDLGWSGANPAHGVKRFTETARDRFLQYEELEPFFRAIQDEPEPFGDFFVLALMTGARRSNVQAMRWDEIDLRAGYWRIGENKSGTPIVVPLIAPALAILQARRSITGGSVWVFPANTGSGHLSQPKRAWNRVCERAGLKNLRPHDLRRSLGSWMAGQNTSLTVIGKVLGHKTSAATMIYSRVAMDPQRAAMDNAVGAMLKAGGAGVKMIEATTEDADNG